MAHHILVYYVVWKANHANPCANAVTMYCLAERADIDQETSYSEQSDEADSEASFSSVFEARSRSKIFSTHVKRKRPLEAKACDSSDDDIHLTQRPRPPRDVQMHNLLPQPPQSVGIVDSCEEHTEYSDQGDRKGDLEAKFDGLQELGLSKTTACEVSSKYSYVNLSAVESSILGSETAVQCHSKHSSTSHSAKKYSHLSLKYSSAVTTISPGISERLVHVTFIDRHDNITRSMPFSECGNSRDLRMASLAAGPENIKRQMFKVRIGKYGKERFVRKLNEADFVACVLEPLRALQATRNDSTTSGSLTIFVSGLDDADM